MSTKVYDIDLVKLAGDMLPAVLRKHRLYNYLRIALHNLISVQKMFYRYRLAVLYDLMITPQVVYLEVLLNDTYDYSQRRIHIVDGKEQPAVYLYVDAEDKPVLLTTDNEGDFIPLYTDSEITGELSDDFIIKIPIAIDFSATELRKLIDRKKLPGMRYSIQLY
jgi:hypothetical protein